LINDGVETTTAEDSKRLRDAMIAFLQDVLGIHAEVESENAKLKPVMDLVIELRQKARENKDWSTSDRIRFHPYYTSKDLVGFFWMAITFSIFVFFYPNFLGHPDNYIPGNPLVTPPSIVPEWYFLPFYAILRAIPSKLGGVIAMISAILILLTLPLFTSYNVRSNRYRPILIILYWLFVFNFLFLMWLGQKHIHEPYVTLGQISTVLYFSYFFIIVFINAFHPYFRSF
jgi:ubiquinol-cytochrome c reductase cytochrome b subunit